MIHSPVKDLNEDCKCDHIHVKIGKLLRHDACRSISKNLEDENGKKPPKESYCAQTRTNLQRQESRSAGM